MRFDNFAPLHPQDPHAPDFRAFFPYTPNEVKHRKRTTTAQLKVLENIFKRDTKPNASLRNELAAQLDMTARGVQVWFQNRRAKEKTKSAKAAAGGNSPSSSSSAHVLLDETSDCELLLPGAGTLPIQLPDASLKPNLPPQLHLITDSSSPSWLHSPVEPPPDSAGYLNARSESAFFFAPPSNNDIHSLRRGSLPVNVFPPSSFHSQPQWFDPLARRRSVDASLQRLAENPYADMARTKNAAVFGARFATAVSGGINRQQHLGGRVPPSRRPPLHLQHNPLSAAPHVSSIRRSSMDARGTRLSLRTNAPASNGVLPASFMHSRGSLPDQRLYAVSSRMVGSPIPGPLPSPNFSFGAASSSSSGGTPSSMASPSSGDSERNSPDSLRSFTYPDSHHEDDGGGGLASPAFDNYSRFNSIASIATSESSSYYSDFSVDPLLPQDLHQHQQHNGSRRNSCSPGQYLDFGDLDATGQYGVVVTETHQLSVAGYPTDDYGISGPQGVTVPESVVASNNAYPSPASTLSAGGNSNSPQQHIFKDSSSSSGAVATSLATLSLPPSNSSSSSSSSSSSLEFALQGNNHSINASSEQQTLPLNTQQRQPFPPTADQQRKDGGVCGAGGLTTGSREDVAASAISSSALYQPQPQQQQLQQLQQEHYTYGPAGDWDNTPEHGHHAASNAAISATTTTGVSSAGLYNAYGELNVSSLDPAGLQAGVVEAFAAYA